MQRPILRCLLTVAVIFIGIGSKGLAQVAPQIGYVFPSGGQAGTTVDVRLGGYNLTPDMQFFVHDPRVTLEILGPPGDILITPPPYWKGDKCNLGDAPLAREIPARITIPGDMPAGTIGWQLANASGASGVGKFVISREDEVVEDELRNGEPQLLSSLPATVSGRLSRIEEVDQYRFVPQHAGLVNCELFAHRLGSPIHGVLEVRDAAANMVADTVDTEGVDPILTFATEADSEYVVSVRDLDFAGNGSHVYRLRFAQGPRVLAAVPAVFQRGETQSIRFFGLGVATGELKLESVTQDVSFPNDPALKTHEYRLETPFGVAAPFSLPMGDVPVIVGSPASDAKSIQLTPPVGITSRLESSGEERFKFEGKQGDVWDVGVQAQRLGSPLDVTLEILGPDGKQLANNDDAGGSTDAALKFTLPADGSYTLVVRDHISGAVGTPLAWFHLSLTPPASEAGFELTVPQSLNAGLGVAAELKVNVVRKGGFVEPISVELNGLPEGATVPDDLVIAADATELKIALTSAADSAVIAKMVEVSGTAQTSGTRLTRNMLLATTMKPRCKIWPVDKDGGRTVHRGSTHPGEVIIERLEGFEGEIRLMMAANQSRHRQGISGPQVVVVPPEDTRAFFPSYLPEWLGTNLTQRMSLIAVAHVPDPMGNVRHLASAMEGNITMSIEGALLKITQQAPDIAVSRGSSFELPVQILRAKNLRAPVRLELVVPPEYENALAAEPITVSVDQNQAQLHVNVLADAQLTGEVRFTVKGTAQDAANLPVVARANASIAVE
jgi:hypothetical protein